MTSPLLLLLCQLARNTGERRGLCRLAAGITLPPSLTTLSGILELPLRSFTTGVGPGLTPQRHLRKFRVMDLYRLYGGDTWHLSPSLTMNYGLAWSYEPNTLNTDLTRPKLLTLGADRLNPPSAQTTNISPTVGFAWAATRDGKTVTRGGAGRYFDPISTNSGKYANERVAHFPAGTGCRTIPGSAILHQGRPLNFPQNPTSFTAADLRTILPAKRTEFLSDLSYQAPYALHFNLGLQRELTRDLALTADVAWRRFLHTFFLRIDYNRFNRWPQGPVIPTCTPAQRNDVTAACSSGIITFDATSGIAEYEGLLVRLEKRFSQRTQFLASYALGSYVGTNGPSGSGNSALGFNNDNWFQNYGPLSSDLRHTLIRFWGQRVELEHAADR